MGIAAAAGIGAVGALGGSLLSSSAAQSAASGQQQTAGIAAANAVNQENYTNGQLSPFTGAATNDLSNYQNITGVNGAQSQTNALSPFGFQGLTFNPTQAQLASTPGYQFDLAQGEQGVANSNAAQGLGVSGAALKGAANYATGLANNTLTTQQGIFQNNLSNIMGDVVAPQASQMNLGENAAAQAGAQGVQSTQNANQALIGGANAAAAGTVGSANALASGLGTAGSTPLNSMLYSQLLGGGSGSSGFYGNTDASALSAAAGSATGNNNVGNSGLGGLY